MDVIYADHNRIDIGALSEYIIDLAYGSDENNMEVTLNINNHCCEAGYLIYIEGTEYGGMISNIEVKTNTSEVIYTGPTWHGLLAEKILEPDAGEDYLVLSGDANTIISTLISRVGLQDLFEASSSSGMTLTNYKMDRYTDVYKGICKMLKSVGAKLNITFSNGKVVLSAVRVVDYSQSQQQDNDTVDLDIQKIYRPINHVICLGSGNLSDRTVIHVYADASGNIIQSKTLSGMDEVTAIYDYPNAESSDELRSGGESVIKEQGQGKSDISFNSDDERYDIGDIVGSKELITGIELKAEIKKKIVTINRNQTTISYQVGEPR